MTRGFLRRDLRAAALCLAALLPGSLAEAKEQTSVPILDAHTHIVRNLRRGEGVDSATSQALRVMDELGVTMTILSPPPFPPDRGDAYGMRMLQALVREHPGRFAFTAGGESLNPMIQETSPANVTPDMRRRFEQEAETIAGSGAAGFGELAAEHFSNRRGRHPYESAPPDHPLFLLLADVAAKHGMPIEPHMEAVPRDMPFPEARSGPPNPARLHENIAAFERLLAHNPHARIIWVHAGWDLTGERTVPLMQSLLERHPNLYMSVKSDEHGAKRNSPFRGDDGIKPEWIALLRAFPDRFVIGSDQFFDQDAERISRARKFVDALPPDVQRAVASENAARIYRLPPLPR